MAPVAVACRGMMAVFSGDESVVEAVICSVVPARRDLPAGS